MPADTILTPEAKFNVDVIVPSPGNDVRSGGVVGFVEGSVKRGFQALFNKIFATVKGKVTFHSLDVNGTGGEEIVLPIPGLLRGKKLVITTDGAEITDRLIVTGFIQASDLIAGKWLDLQERISDNVLPSTNMPVEGQLYADGIAFARAKVKSTGTYQVGYGIKSVEKLAGSTYRITTLYCPLLYQGMADGTDLDNTVGGPGIALRMIGNVAAQGVCAQQVITVDGGKRVEITVKTFDGAGNPADRGFDLFVYP